MKLKNEKELREKKSQNYKRAKNLNKDSDELKLPTKAETVAFYKKVSQNRFKSFSGYKLDRWLFNFIMWGLFVFFFLFAYKNQFDLDYYKCGSQNPVTGYMSSESCENPFYKPVSWKNQAVLYPGEYGKKPTTLFNFLWIITIGSFILGAFINHAIHNRGYKKNDLL